MCEVRECSSMSQREYRTDATFFEQLLRAPQQEICFSHTDACRCPVRVSCLGSTGGASEVFGFGGQEGSPSPASDAGSAASNTAPAPYAGQYNRPSPLGPPAVQPIPTGSSNYVSPTSTGTSASVAGTHTYAPAVSHAHQAPGQPAMGTLQCVTRDLSLGCSVHRHGSNVVEYRLCAGERDYSTSDRSIANPTVNT